MADPSTPSAPGSEQRGRCENTDHPRQPHRRRWPSHGISNGCIGWRPLDPRASDDTVDARAVIMHNNRVREELEQRDGEINRLQNVIGWLANLIAVQHADGRLEGIPALLGEAEKKLPEAEFNLLERLVGF